MLLPFVIVLCLLGIMALFAFAYLMDKWHGPAAIAVLSVWIWNMQPAEAQQPPSDANWPAINDPTEPVLVGHNVFGDKIVLFANFCNGDGARRDHMHTYGIYGHNGTFIQGGCWQWNPEHIKATRTIRYFDMNGMGWDSWPAQSFHIARTLPH